MKELVAYNWLKIFRAFPAVLVLGMFFLATFSNCDKATKKTNKTIAADKTIQQKDTNKVADLRSHLSAIESNIKAAGLIDIQLLNPDIQVFLRYASDNNFLHQNLYDAFNKAYLADECAKKIALAQTFLSRTKPGFKLLVWDAARPVSAQQLMWDALDMPFEERTKYVSNPKNHSLHNYGCAVDLTIQDSLENELDMGTDFDDFDTLAQPQFEWLCLQRGTLNPTQIENRKLLRSLMKKAGFTILPSEWWHFNCCSRVYAKEHYIVVE